MTIPNENHRYLGHDPESSSLQILKAALPGRTPTPWPVLAQFLGANSLRVESDSEESAISSCAIAYALAHVGRVDDAIALLDQNWDDNLLTATQITSVEIRCLCLSALSEVYLLAGRLDRASYCAQLSTTLAYESSDPVLLLRAKTLLCASEALDGHYKSVEHRLATATLELPAGSTVNSWPLDLARVLLAVRRNDHETLAVARNNLADHITDDPVVRSVAWFAEITSRAFLGDFAGVAAAIACEEHSVEGRWYPTYIKDLATALEVIALLHLQDPQGAWNACAERESPPGHAVCFPLLRASIQINLGQASEALRITDGCVQRKSHHSMSTLASLLLRRSVAFEMLGLHEAADVAYSQASHLAVELGQLSPALALPLNHLENLMQRMLRKEPEFAQLVLKMLDTITHFPSANLAPSLEFLLTDRERLIAQWLPTDCSLADIARNLFVSHNTVKTQVRSIYAKLGVTSRPDAVAMLEAKGFYCAFPVQTPTSSTP